MVFDHTYRYKAFVLLNNTGVSLLNQHRYNDAVLTFHDALTVMKEAVNLISINDSDSDIHIKKMLQAANQRKYQSARNTPYQDIVPNIQIHEVSDSTNIAILVSHINDVDIGLSKEGKTISFNKTNIQLFAFRIDFEFQDEINVQDLLEIWSAIVLNNQSLSLKCLSTVFDKQCSSTDSTSISNSSIHYVNKSYHLSRKAYAVLANQYYRLENQHIEDLDITVNRMNRSNLLQHHHLVSCVVINNIIMLLQSPVLSKLNFEQEQFTKLLRPLVESFSNKSNNDKLTTAAAA